MELDPYDWLVIHKDGRRHTNAHAMSQILAVASTIGAGTVDDLLLIHPTAISNSVSCTDSHFKGQSTIGLTR